MSTKCILVCLSVHKQFSSLTPTSSSLSTTSPQNPSQQSPNFPTHHSHPKRNNVIEITKYSISCLCFWATHFSFRHLKSLSITGVNKMSNALQIKSSHPKGSPLLILYSHVYSYEGSLVYIVLSNTTWKEQWLLPYADHFALSGEVSRPVPKA